MCNFEEVVFANWYAVTVSGALHPLLIAGDSASESSRAAERRCYLSEYFVSIILWIV